MPVLADIIPSHDFALLLQKCIGSTFRFFEIRPSETLKEVVYAIVVTIVAMAIGWIFRKLVLTVARRIMNFRPTPLTQEMVKQHVLLHCSHIIPPLVMQALLPFAFASNTPFLRIAERLIWVYTAIVIAIAVNSILTLIWSRYNERENTKNLPLKGILNTAKGIVWVITVIAAAAVILDKSPTYLFTGLGAFAAALMLIFKDSILGFVAGLQLSQNDMLRVGDWIVVPNTEANGVVLDMSLSAVKVQNWDNTIVTLPPYTLVSTSFKNYRGMYDAGCRQIDRSVLVDANTIRPISADDIARITSTLPLLDSFVAKIKANTPVFDNGLAVVNGTVDTNLGLLRAYLCEYILQSKDFDHSQQVLVRVTAPQPQGVPLDIYCYTSTTGWTAYEAIQSALFEHIFSIAPIFGLSIYNAPSGTDLKSLSKPV
mgnify:FL=1